jgi:HK97 family phage prohead protease
MPYYISDTNPDCGGWAVEKEDGEVIGCHTTKQAAIDQMVAVSIAEDMEPGGERAEARQVDLTLPDYIRQAAARGLEMYEAGQGGDGLVERTIREARAMARGEVTADKVIRVAAWGARHEPDLRADGARPDEDGFPTPGAVAHYLWGIPTGGRYDDARAFWDRKAAQVREDEGRAMIEVTPVEPRSKKSGIEFRQVDGEIRALDGDGNRFVGYAAVFNSDSENLGGFVERIRPGAFAKTLRNKRRDVRAYVNHDSNMVLASSRSGTLQMSEDDRGLRVEFDLPEGVTYASDLRALMTAGIVDKMSFGFTIPRKGDEWSDDGTRRELREVVLHEVSVVTGHPAYTATAAAVRSLDGLAERTGMAVEEVSQTLDALADGEDIDPDKADALIAAIKGQTKQEQPDLSLLGLKAKQTELLAKKVF